jgi:alpha-galactosidase
METVARRLRIAEPETRFGLPPWCTPWAEDFESLAQVALRGEEPPSGYAQGLTMRGGAATRALRFVDQRVEPRTESSGLPDSAGACIVTRLAGAGLEAEHRLTWRPGAGAVESATSVRNAGSVPVCLDLLSSFVLDGITPFAEDDAANRLWLHRARSAWSAEGRWESRTLESLGLERSWQPHAVRCERFGQVGSLPVRGWFPCAVLEDRQAGVCWGAQLAWPGSWQLEVYRRGDAVSLSGGLADREFGHWRKTLAPGESFTSPPALLTVCRGDLDECRERLVKAQEGLRGCGEGVVVAGRWESSGFDRSRQASNDVEALSPAPSPSRWLAVEHDLPVVCNEFCASWGEPTHASLEVLAKRLQGTGVRYLVIDAGWYADPGTSWCGAHGDWVPSAVRFPDGLAATAAMIRAQGLVPGLWLEPETVGANSAAFGDVEGLLQRDGVPITVGGRRFRDLRQPAVFGALARQIVELVRWCGFGYVKIDYNETLGIGVDGAESPGEGLRQHIEAVQAFYRRLRADLPDVVVEHCASGGHRLEPAMLALADMASFSDAHESRGIPLLAAAQHRLVAPRQLQIWAVLRKEHTADELRGALVNGFLGRLCLSGELAALDAAQWSVVEEALALYRRVVPVIRDGSTRVYGDAAAVSWRHPEGTQVVVRTAADGTSALIVAHGFGFATSTSAPLPVAGSGRRWSVAGELAGAGDALHVVDGAAQVSFVGADERAGVWLLKAVPAAVHSYPAIRPSGRSRNPLPELVPA